MTIGTISSPPASPSSPPLYQHLTSTTISPYQNLPSDCINIIFHYHTFHLQNGTQWKEVTRCHTNVYHEDAQILIHDLESEEMDDSNWNFLSKFAHCCRFCGDEGIGEFISECRDLEWKPTFSYLQLDFLLNRTLFENGVVEYLRGIPELHISCYQITTVPSRPNEEDLDSLFQNIRGVKKLDLYISKNDNNGPFTSKHLENLRGIQEAYFSGCDFSAVEDSGYENLRGIQSLTCRRCIFSPNNQLLVNLRGIKELHMDECTNPSFSAQSFRNIRGVQKFSFDTDAFQKFAFTLTDHHLEQLRGISELKVVEIANNGSNPPPPLTDSSFKNLRGAKKVVLLLKKLEDITDAAFENLRGVEELSLAFIPHVTSAALENFRGIRKLRIARCPGIKFEAESLCNLRGSMKELFWEGYQWHHEPCKNILDIEAAKQFYAVEKLHMDSVHIASEETFRHLSKVKHLRLGCSDVSVPLSDTAFSYLSNIQFMILKGAKLEKVRKFSDLLQNTMPHLEFFQVGGCTIDKDSVESDWDVHMLRDKAYINFIRKNGEWSAPR